MSCYVCEGQVNANELQRRAVLGTADQTGCSLGDTGCPTAGRQSLFGGGAIPYRQFFAFEHCLLLELPGHPVVPGIRNLFLWDAPWYEATDPKLSTAENDAWLKSGTGIYIRPFTLLGIPQKTVSFLCSFIIKSIPSQGREGGHILGAGAGGLCNTHHRVEASQPHVQWDGYTCLSQGRREGQKGPWYQMSRLNTLGHNSLSILNLPTHPYPTTLLTVSEVETCNRW